MVILMVMMKIAMVASATMINEDGEYSKLHVHLILKQMIDLKIPSEKHVPAHTLKTNTPID